MNTKPLVGSSAEVGAGTDGTTLDRSATSRFDRVGGSRTAASWITATIAAGILPIPTHWGSLYGLEIILLARLCFNLRRFASSRLRLSASLVAMAALLAMLIADFLVGLAGPNDQAIHVLRALVELAVAILLFDWDRPFRRAFVAAIPWMGVVAVGALLAELMVGHPLIPGKATSPLDATTLRLVGPIGPGSTATLCITALAVARRSHRWMIPLLILGVLLTGSRAHLPALVIVVLVYAIRPARKALAALAGIVAGVVATNYFLPSVFRRFAEYTNDSSSRLSLWSLAWTQMSGKDWLWGVGPAGFYGDATTRVSSIAFPHSQFLVIPLYAGVVGWPIAIALITDLAIRARRAKYACLFLGLLVSCIFGEFVVPVLVGGMCGALGFWAAVTDGAEGDDAS